MKAEENPCSDSSSSCNLDTNWTISNGSLANSITVESSLSTPIEDSRISTPNSPLILSPSASDSGSCDIKISFAQKHEVRQVYVRSTARTYEIYYAPNMQSDNEYLCTVRCSLAAEEDSLQATEVELSNGSSKQLDERSKSDSNISTSEEDWVEVRKPDSPPLDRTINMNSGRTQQDFYEATAEFTNAEACTSLTLRMLSLQDKGCIQVDEVYVYADPVDSDDLDDQQGRVENSAGSSLMAMLVPTLLQLSKAGTSQGKDKSNCDKTKEQTVQKIGSDSTCNRHDLEIKSNMVEQPEDKVPEHNQSRVPGINSNSESTFPETSVPYNSLEKFMDQLVSRVSKMEDFFLRFEERMLKPIFSIDARLERVEQQLEILTKNPQYCGFISGTRFSAPDFSCTESGSNSFYNDVNDFPIVGPSESDNRDSSFSKLATPAEDTSNPVNGLKLVHGLKITAPEFPNIDDEEHLNGPESMTNKQKEITAPEFPNFDDEEHLNGPESMTDKPKETVSIDDALASALTGFMCSASIPTQCYTQALAIKAPEFSNDEDSNEGAAGSLKSHSEIAMDSSLSSDKASVGNESAAVICPNNEKVDDEQSQNNEGEERCHVIEEIKVTSYRQISESVFGLPISDDTVNPTHLPEVLTKDISNNIVEGSTENTLQNVLEFSLPPRVLDFETSIVEVTFNNSQENPVAKSFLESLLGSNNTEQSSNIEDPPNFEKSDSGTGLDDNSHLISVEHEESSSAVPGNDLIENMFDYELDQPVSEYTDDEVIQGRYYSCSHEIFATSLI